jgi:hypothetical protein
MPKRVIDFDAMWGSDKLASCADWAQAEYAWLYGLADASGCFEMTNLRVIWGRVAAVRGNFTIERLEQVLHEFQDKGLLFVWAHEGKRYAHWTGSDVPGRLPPPSWRMRLEKFAPPVPKQQLAEYMGRFARGRAAFAGAGFRAETSAVGGRREVGLKAGVEEDQAQDWDLNLNLYLKRNGNWEVERNRAGTQLGNTRMESDSHGKKEIKTAAFYNSNAGSTANTKANENARASATSNASALTGLKTDSEANSNEGENSRGGSSEINSNTSSRSDANSNFHSNAGSRWNALGNEMRNAAGYRMTAREIAVERELRVGAGPVCGPVRIRPEVLERIRLREEAQARARAETRSP